VTSVINTLEEDVTIESPHVQLEEIESTDESAFVIFSSTIIEDESRLFRLRHDLRTDRIGYPKFIRKKYRDKHNKC
jgi:hypothetical protein